MDFIDHRSTAKFIFKTSATDEKARIDDSGNILTGKTSSNFSTAGAEVRNLGNIWATRDGGVPLALNRLSSEGTIAQFYKDGSSLGVIASVSSDFVIYSTISGHTGLRFGDGWIGSTNNAGTLQNGTVSLGTTAYKFADLHLSGNANIGGNATITGDLTVNGTTTTLNTATLDVEDKNITLNYGAGDTSSTADGAGITIQDAVDASNNATILWDATNDEFDFSHAINVPSLTTTGNVSFGDNDKAIFGAGSDLQIYHDGSNSYVADVGTGQLNVQGTNLYLKNGDGSEVYALFQEGANNTYFYYNGSQKLAVTNTGIDVTGTVVSDGVQSTDGNIKVTTSGSFVGFNSQRAGVPSSGGYQLGRLNFDAYSTGTTFVSGASIQSFSDGAAWTSSSTPAYLSLQTTPSGSTSLKERLKIANNGDISFYEDTGTTAKLTWSASDEDLKFADNSKAIFGAGSDVSIYSDGTNGLITSTANFTLDVAGDITLDADGADIKLLNGGTHWGSLYTNSTPNNLYLQNMVSDGDIYLSGFDGGSNISALILDMSAAGAATFNAGASFGGTVTTDGLEVEAAAPVLEISSTTLSSLASINFTSGGSDIDSKITHQGNTGVMTIDSGRNATWGGKIDFVTDTDTRMRISNNGDISFYDSAGSSQSLFWDASTKFLGLGSTAPAAKLDIVDTASDVQMRVYKNDGTKNTRITVTADDSGAKIHYRDADNAGALRFNNNLGEVMRITANTTRVGIGTSAPAAPLEVQSSVSGNYVARFQNTNATTPYGVWIKEPASAASAYPSFTVTDSSGSATRLRVDSGTGNVGIGTSSPDGSLDIEKTVNTAWSSSLRANDFLQISNPSTTSGSYSGIELIATGTGSAGAAEIVCIDSGSGSGDLAFSTRNGGTWGEKVRIEASGNVGIGVSPTFSAGGSRRLLQLTNGASGGQLAMGNNANESENPRIFSDADNLGFATATTGGGFMQFYTGGSERIRLDSSGNLLVGGSSAYAQGATTIANGGILYVSRSAGGPATFRRNFNDGSIITLEKDGTTVGSIGVDSSLYLKIDTSYSGLFFDNGKLLPTANGSLSDGGQDLGRSATRFKDLYLSGYVKANSGYQVGTTTVIGSSRNLTNIVSAQIGNSTDSRGVATFNVSHSSTNTSGAGTGADIGDSNRNLAINNPNNNGNAGNYASLSLNLNPSNNTYRCMADIKLMRTSANSSANRLTFTQRHSDGTFYNNLVINSDGNVDVRGAISSGAITSSGSLTVTDFVKASGNNLKFSAGGNHIMNIDLNGKIYPQTDNHTDLGFSATAARFRNLNLSGNITVGGSTVIDSSRNITAGTISSGAITSSGTVTANGLTVDGAIAFTDSGSSNRNVLYLDGSNNVVLATGTTAGTRGIDLYTNNSKSLSVAEGGDISFYEDTGTTAKLFWDASLESLGIGTTSLTPTDGANIELSSSTSSRLLLDNTGASGRKYAITSDTSGNLGFYDYDASAFRILVDSSGDVGIGTSSPTSVQGFAKVLKLEDSSHASIVVSGGSHEAEYAVSSSGGWFGTSTNIPQRFITNNTERTRIDSSGNQLWGKTSADNTTQGIRMLGSSGFMSVVRSSNTLAVFNRIDSDGTLINFRTNGTTRGSISISGSTTSYNTTSDQRLKRNIEDADNAGAIIDSIQVRKFDWIYGGEHQRYGMVAQELSTVAPEAVSVPDDAEEMQSVDYSKLVPMMLKEIQTLRARVAQLEGEN